jgi:hypothetical protein
VSTDGFERASAGAQPPALGGSRFEGAGPVKALHPRLEKYKSLLGNVVGQILADDKLSERVANRDPKTLDSIQNALVLAGMSSHVAKYATDKVIVPLVSAARSGSGSTRPLDDYGYTLSTGTQQGATDYFTSLLDNAKTVEDYRRILDDTVAHVKLAEGETVDALRAFTAIKLGESMKEKGIGPGRVPGRDWFQGHENGGIVPDERLEDLPAKLEPHREVLEKLTGQLLRDSKLDNDGRLRKALWGELKKLPFPNDGVRRVARQHLLEEMALRQDRYVE